MKEKSPLVVGGLVLLLLIFPLGFLVHVSPRFPGSPIGSLIGVAGAVLMLVPFVYLVIKRVPALHDRVTRHISMAGLLTIHIYSGVLGPILGLVHSAHKFNSPLGVALTGMMLVVVLSGYFGRYLLGQLARAVRGRRSDLAAVQEALSRAPSEPEVAPGAMAGLLAWARRSMASPPPEKTSASLTRLQLAEAVADLEFAVRAEALVQSLFEKWLKLHIVIAMVLYALLALHIWAGLYYGLSWL